MIVRESHLQCIQRQVDIGAILVAARGWVALHHLHRVFGEGAGSALLTPPVRVSHAGDDFAAFFQCIQHRCYVKFPVQRGFDADLDVIEIDKHGQF